MAKYYSNATDLITFTRGSSATYIGSDGTRKTAASDEPRIDYADDRSLKGLLIEEQRTNLLLNSDNPDTQVATLPAGSHTLSFVGGPSVTGISDSIDVNAVDVFVYDTSKDSDGGAWRTGSLAQASSWYAEASSPTRDANTRSTRAEFPAVAVIVAEANKVTIYDGDDPSLPMWMVFNASGGLLSDARFLPGSNVTAVNVLNGVLAVSDSNATSGRGGLYVANFNTETLRHYNGLGTVTTRIGDIAGRNDQVGWENDTDASYQIADTTVNDVAMTVLPDAPTDPATGLPVPTIAVATDGGVSVIKDDGTVVDIVHSDNALTRNVTFGGDDLLIYNAASFIHARPIPTADVSAGNRFVSNAADVWFAPRFTDASYTGGSFELHPSGGNTVGDVIQSGDFVAIKNTDRLNLARVKGTYAEDNALSAFVTSDYATGWMPGSIKMAALADTTAETLSGSELVPNGDFPSGLSDGDVGYDNGDGTVDGWANYNNSNISVVSNKMRVANGATGRAGAGISFSTVVGEVYVLHFDGISGSVSDVFAYVGDSLGSASVAYIVNVNGVGLQITFVAENTTTWATFKPANTGNGSYVEFDNISVRLADPDRSVNGKGLGVHGSITKQAVATGADVVAYSGFSASNYLEQPYNSDLDFGAYTGTAGTGDFCVMGWVKGASVMSTATIVSRCSSTSNGFHLFKNTTTTTPYARFRIGSTYLDGTTGIADQWNHLVAMRKDGVAYIYKNGALENSASISTDVSGSFATEIGWSTAQTTITGLAGISLLRISATAPTADQIAKIYDDEKVLFQPNAKATLTGSSNNVTALAHDPDTNLLHVGTSGGRSVFYGLRRVNETATAVTTAISAVDGLIVEQ